MTGVQTCALPICAIESNCTGDFVEDWDVEGLQAEINTFWPTSLTPVQIHSATTTDELYDLIMTEGVAHYHGREEELGSEQMREIERQVMLRVIDARWRDHLKEMDYLQEGIGLRAMGQKDPLTEWQREGYDMFGQLMDTVADEFVKYVMHVQVVVEDQSPAVRNMTYTSPDDPSAGPGPAPAVGMTLGTDGAEAAAPAEEPRAQAPVVKSDWDKTPRNAPCPCGSGKKFKQCHGAA